MDFLRAMLLHHESRLVISPSLPLFYHALSDRRDFPISVYVIFLLDLLLEGICKESVLFIRHDSVPVRLTDEVPFAIGVGPVDIL